MDKKYLKIISIIISLLIIISPLMIYAEPEEEEEVTHTTIQAPVPGEWPTGPEVSSLAATVIDFNTGTVLYEKNATEAHFPASITKVMTALVALENSKLDETVTFSRNAVFSIEAGSSSISRDENEQMTMEECLYGLMLESANECANAIAEHVGGDVETFVNMMNEKAAKLGCVNTHFVNPHGLHNPDHYTCPQDMAKIARAAYENPTFALITGTKNYTIPPTNKHEDPTPLNNHHAMLNYYRTNKYLYEYCVGGKTGYTSDALGTLVTYCTKDGLTLICVTMCAPGSDNYKDTTNLMEYYLNSMQTIKISDLDGDFSQISANNISSLMGKSEVPFEIDEDATVLLPMGASKSDIEIEYGKEEESVDTEALGYISFAYKGKKVGIAGIHGKEVETVTFKNTALDEDGNKAEKYVVVNLFRIILIVIGIIVLIVIVLFAILQTNNAVAVARRKRIENRDPHKNMRRIRRRRKHRGDRR